MNPAASALDGELWQFALRFYGRPGVASACLVLQNRLSLDVNILLLALFASLERQVALGSDDIAAADTRVAPWRSLVVQGLRRIRTELKAGPEPAPSPVTDLLREDVKKLELRAEQIELAVLLGWLGERHAPAGSGRLTADDPVRIVARHFAGSSDSLSDPEVADALRTISDEARKWRAVTLHT